MGPKPPSSQARAAQQRTRVHFQWIERVLSEDGPESPVTRLVGAALFRHMDKLGSCYPSEEKLAAETGLARRTIVSHISRLKTEGFIDIRRRIAQGKKWALNHYVARFPPLARSSASAAPRSTEGSAASASAGAVDSIGSASDSSLVVRQMHTNTPVNTTTNTSRNQRLEEDQTSLQEHPHARPTDKTGIEERIAMLRGQIGNRNRNVTRSGMESLGEVLDRTTVVRD